MHGLDEWQRVKLQHGPIYPHHSRRLWPTLIVLAGIEVYGYPLLNMTETLVPSKE